MTGCAGVDQAARAGAARNVDYNGALGAGATTESGFLGSVSGANTAPTLSCAAV
jgi:hypothetical protein